MTRFIGYSFSFNCLFGFAFSSLCATKCFQVVFLLYFTFRFCTQLPAIRVGWEMGCWLVVVPNSRLVGPHLWWGHSSCIPDSMAAFAVLEGVSGMNSRPSLDTCLALWDERRVVGITALSDRTGVLPVISSSVVLACGAR